MTEEKKRVATDPRPQAGTTRRRILLSLLGGALGGGLIGATGPALARSDLLPDLPGLPGADGLTDQTDRTLAVHGGDDTDEARANALHVWELSPSSQDDRLRASYVPVGRSSTEQFSRIRNHLAAGTTDLVVIDPQYLRQLADAEQVRTFRRTTAQSLRDQGCFRGLVQQCEVGEDLYAVPLNADAPLLVADLTRLPAAAARDFLALADERDPRAFWLSAARIAGQATGGAARTVRIQTDGEALTVCLVELLAAFGADVAADPGLRTEANLAALRRVRRELPSNMFLQPAGREGDETATVEALAAGEVALARLWPVYARPLVSGAVTDEGGAATYARVPVPGGVLGGQVLALPATSPDTGAAERLASHLAGPMSQLQLFYAGGYVPTLRQLHADTRVAADLGGIGARLGAAALRPQLLDYTSWSSAFRLAVRGYLLGDGDDTGPVKRALGRFAVPE